METQSQPFPPPSNSMAPSTLSAEGRPVSLWAASVPAASVWDLLLRPTDDADSLDPARRDLFWDAVSRRLASHPEDAAVDLYQLYPLHRALMNGAPPGIIRQLVDSYPAAVWTDNYNNDFPLHIACINEHPPEVVRLLIDAYPDALHHRADGLLPLHWAAEYWRTNPAGFDLVLAEGKRQRVEGCWGSRGLGGLLLGDKAGHTPLDYICDDVAKRGECDAERWGWVCDLLRRCAGEALGLVTMGDGNGGEKALTEEMPVLHAALELSCSLPFIKLLLAQNPHAITQRDCLNRTPLTVATCNSATHDGIIEALLNAGSPSLAQSTV